MAKNAHLTLDERAHIEVSLREGDSFTEIGKELGKDPSTISKEVKNHSQTVRKGSYNPCANRTSCSYMGKACKPCKHPYHGSCKGCTYRNCYEHCPDFIELTCQKLNKPPYVCNGCDTRMRCKLERHLYDAKNAQKEYESIRSESRQGIAITPTELKRIDGIISPLVKQGQSIHMICANNSDNIMLDEKTIYNYIDAGLLSVDNIDLSLMMSHINSYCRKKLNDQSSHQLFSFLNSVEILEKLNTKLIPANEIVRIIVNEFGGTNILITADHGFLYTYSPLTEDDKVDKSSFNGMDVEYGRRYAIMQKDAQPNYLLPVKFLGGNTEYDGFAPRESIRIKMNGGGLNFVHGGISLQEMVVPVIEYHYLRNDSMEYKRNKQAERRF